MSNIHMNSGQGTSLDRTILQGFYDQPYPPSRHFSPTISTNEISTLFPPGNRAAPPPPIGVFWDIENCSIPKGKSALEVVNLIRNRFFNGLFEAEFVCVCDIKKESAQIIQELNDGQVSVVHVAGSSKNASDDKLRQAMRRYADVYTRFATPNSSPPTIVLISGDINFATDLSDLKYRKKLYVILLHNKHAPEALIICANEHYDFHNLLRNIPQRNPQKYKEVDDPSTSRRREKSKSRGETSLEEFVPLKGGLDPMDVVVSDLPPRSKMVTDAKIKSRLRKLSDNCGGKVLNLQGAFGVIRFPNKEAALRASKRMNGEDVFGSTIKVIYSSQMDLHGKRGGSGKPPIPFGNSSANHQKKVPWTPNWKEDRRRDTSSTSSVSISSRDESPYNKYNGGNMRLDSCSSGSSFHSAGGKETFQEPSNLYTATQSMEALAIHNSMDTRNSYAVAVPHDNYHMNGAGVGIQPEGNAHFGNSPAQTSSYTSPHSSKFHPEPFDLHVSNIDPNLGDWKGVRQSLMTAFAEHVNVKGISIYAGQDGSVSGIVRVPNKDEAHIAVSKLHRNKIGNKRISISFDQGTTVDIGALKFEVAAVLQDVPNHSLPLFKFREMFEKRYRRSVSASDLYKMKDVVSIFDQMGINGSPGLNSSGSSSSSSCGLNPTGRTISLAKEWKAKNDELGVFCKLHPPRKMNIADKGFRTGWAEKEVGNVLPNVIVEFKVFSSRVNSLLQTHNGVVPLLSFMDCYSSDFVELERSTEGKGVPLEHLLASVQGVEISLGDNGMKKIMYSERKEEDFGINPSLATQLSQLSRELVDLLKTMPRCTMPFSKLIPAYHHHFGRQCRVADYGHFSLSQLLFTLPQTIQVMAENQNRVITLSHRAQMKRFATDLLRVLKSQGGPKKQIKVADFPSAFSSVFPQRVFAPEDYGLCFLDDLIKELVENSTLVALINEEGTYYLAIPRRDQTPQEIHRTRIFATEVIELLRFSIRCEMPFSKFIPSYHHHFGRQCRVSDYGFSKLAELFEAITETILILNPGHVEVTLDEKIIRLTPKEQIKVVGEQISSVLEKRESGGLKTKISDLDELFLLEQGFLLRPDYCEADDLEDLIINKLHQYVNVQAEDGHHYVYLVDRVHIEKLVEAARLILEERPGCMMELNEFLATFGTRFGDAFDESVIERDLAHILSISDSENGRSVISLAPLRIFASEITNLLEENGGSIPLSSLEPCYLQKFGRPLRVAQLGFPTLMALLSSISDVVTVRGKPKMGRYLILNANRKRQPHWDKGYPRKTERRMVCGSPVRQRHYRSPPLYSSPSYQGGNMNMGDNSNGGGTPRNVFSFENNSSIASPPMYDLWVGEHGNAPPPTPPLSPPVLWTYHPIVYPPPTPPGTTTNLLMPTFSFGSPWSPPPLAYERVSPPAGQNMGQQNFGTNNGEY